MIENQTDEALTLVMEECSEVIQAITKFQRFGSKSTGNGKLHLTNEEHLIKEIADLIVVLDYLLFELDVDNEDLEDFKEEKRESIQKYCKFLGD